MSSIMKFFIGLLLLILLGWIGFYTHILPTGSQNTGHHQDAQNRLQAKVDEITTDQFPWARIRMDGQKAYILGIAPSDQAAQDLKHAILHADGQGGLVMGGITVVDAKGINTADPINVAIASPYTWEATYTAENPVTVSGYVPSEDARRQIITAAEALYPAGVIDNMEIARGVPSSKWVQATIQKLTALRDLDRGGIKGIDDRFTLYGEADSAEKKAHAEQKLRPFVTGYDTVVTISNTAPPPLPEEDTNEALADISTEAPPLDEVPETAPPTAEVIEAVENCQSRFDQTLADKSINFISSKADILADSLPLLDQLAGVAQDCAAYKIEIGGHTDSTGSDDLNMALSQNRAKAVVDYLESKGVATSQIKARGFGETAPIADNTTRIGRAQNRRIEFKVSSQ